MTQHGVVWPTNKLYYEGQLTFVIHTSSPKYIRFRIFLSENASVGFETWD